MRFILILIFSLTIGNYSAQKSSYSYTLAVLKYNGGGDWYANPTGLPNLVDYCNKNLSTNINPEVEDVDVASIDLFNYPLVHLTGHGNVVFNQQEAENLRTYLIGGGFLHISDNYGLDKFIRPQMKKVFPELEFIELSFTHEIYHQKYNFNKGLPKIHEHDAKAPQGFGLIYEGKLICFYDFECDLGDGWEDAEVHNDSKEAREKALQMGANIIQFSMLYGLE